MWGVESVSVKRERAGAGGFRSARNLLSQNAAESDTPRTRAGLRTRVPVPPGPAGHGAPELCRRLHPLFRLPSVPAAAATAAAAPPDAANYWLWSLERAGESPSCGAGLRQPLANQRAAPRTPGLGRDLGARGGAGRGQPETYTLAGPSGTPARRAPAGVWRGQAWRGREAGVKRGGGRASTAAEPSRELRASRVCRDCRKDEEDLLLSAYLSPSHIFIS